MKRGADEEDDEDDVGCYADREVSDAPPRDEVHTESTGAEPEHLGPVFGEPVSD